jgi:hypothetical protein
MPGSMSGFVVPNRVGNRKWVGNAFLVSLHTIWMSYGISNTICRGQKKIWNSGTQEKSKDQR